MSATIIQFPRAIRLPREAITDTIERLIAILDAEDGTAEDLEPDECEEDDDDAEPENWREWHTRKGV